MTSQVTMILPYSPLRTLAGLEYATVQAAKSLDGTEVTVVIQAVGSSGVIDGVAIDGCGGFGRLAWCAATTNSDLVHFMELWPTPWLRRLQLTISLLLRLRGKRVVTTIATFGNITSRTGSRFEAQLWAWTNTCIVGLNVNQRQELVSRSIGAASFRICPRGVPDEYFSIPRLASLRQGAREALGLPRTGVLVLFLGRFVARKRPVELAEEWERSIVASRQCHLLFVGSGEGNEDSVEAGLLAIVARNPDTMLLRGWTNEPLTYLRACDIFVLPSEREGQPNTLLQAMASGLAVVVTSTPGLKDLVQDTSTGLLAPDVRGTVSAIEMLADDARQRDSLGANAATYVAHHHTMSHVRAFHRDLYHDLLK